MLTNILNFEEHSKHFITTLVEYTPKVISAILVLFIGLWLIKRLAKLTDKTLEKRELDISLRTFLKSLITIGLKVILIVTVAGMIGIGTTSFVTILGAAGLAVGLALQGSLSNFAGGVLLLIFKPYRVDDLIEAQGQIGVVTEIQIFNTILLTSDLKTIILPNGAVSNGTIVNHSKNGMLRGYVEIVVSAQNDIDLLKKLLFEAMAKHEYILKSPLPEISAIKIIDNSVTLSIKPYGLCQNFPSINSDVVLIAKEIFEKHNITAPVQKRMIQKVS